MHWTEFSTLLARFTKAGNPVPSDVLFGDGLNLSSIGFTEFIMEYEEVTGADVDIDDLDASIRTAGQLFYRLTGGVAG